MRCHICDKPLASDEIKHTPAYGRGNFGPCGTCSEIIENVFEPLDEEEIDKQLALDFYYEGLQEDNDNEENSS